MNETRIDQENSTVDFLQRLRPGGPWVLTAITPDGPTTTITARMAFEVENFVKQHNGKKNLYYSVNPTRTDLTKKASKTDIAAVEYLLADLDPADGEAPDEAKARYLQRVNDGFDPKPTVTVDSGNGLQLLWRLAERISLGKPTKDGELNAVDEAVVAEIEGSSKALMELLGAKSGTQNIDRVLRLPGTTNLPNKAKLRAGRVTCEARLIEFNDTAYPRDAFSVDAGKDAQEDRKPESAKSDEDELWKTVRDGGQGRHGETRSHNAFWAVCEMLRRGYRSDAIVKILLDPANRVSDHVREQGSPRQYAERQVVEATEKLTFATNDKGAISRSANNVRIALLKLGVTVKYDRFADRVLLSGLDGFGPYVEDSAIDRLWLTIDQRFQFQPGLDFLRIIVSDAARLNGFHPVLDYLDGLRWDGFKRIDSWLTTYAGADDNEYTRAVGAITLMAAVRRVRQPGCKFDEMLVFETPLQGTDKSTAIRILAVNHEWFSDDLPLNVELGQKKCPIR
jgi:hypothetical protein